MTINRLKKWKKITLILNISLSVISATILALICYFIVTANKITVAKTKSCFDSTINSYYDKKISGDLITPNAQGVEDFLKFDTDIENLSSETSSCLKVQKSTYESFKNSQLKELNKYLDDTRKERILAKVRSFNINSETIIAFRKQAIDETMESISNMKEFQSEYALHSDQSSAMTYFKINKSQLALVMVFLDGEITKADSSPELKDYIYKAMLRYYMSGKK